MKPFIHQFFTVLLILSITVTIIIYYAVKIEPYTVTINNVNLNNNFPENLKIIQISDIQISENYQASDFQKINFSNKSVKSRHLHIYRRSIRELLLLRPGRRADSTISRHFSSLRKIRSLGKS